MNTYAEKTQENKKQTAASVFSRKQDSVESAPHFVDNRPEAIAQRRQQRAANMSPLAKTYIAFQETANGHTARQQRSSQKKKNKTGLPDNLKSGVENLSGYSMDDVTVHFNSTKPAQLQAHAYAQGTDIHLAAGQEKHLPHEVWHVVQQKQGRVKPTMQIHGAVNINNDEGLEKEADAMGARAVSLASQSVAATNSPQSASFPIFPYVIQRAVPGSGKAFKETPETGRYRAAGGTQEIFSSQNYPRARFNFGIHTRQDVFNRMQPELVNRQGNRVVSVYDQAAQRWVNVEGVQLDHRVSWYTIATTMDAHNSAVPLGSAIKQYYTFWDAKMYYNDITNLNPILGAINAGAGEHGVELAPRLPASLAASLGVLRNTFDHLQAAYAAIFEGQQDVDVPPEISDRILSIADEIAELSELTQANGDP